MSAIALFTRFLFLGLTSFGGPAAHVGYFRKQFVDGGQIPEAEFGRLLAMTQVLPGPGSSQLGFALGYRFAGLPGAMAAFLGFTLPSFLLMTLLAVAAPGGAEGWMHGLVGGLKLLAVVVVADAVLSMSRAFCTDVLTRALAVGTAVVMWQWPGMFVQMALLVVAATIGYRYLCESSATPRSSAPPVRWANPWLLTFLILFLLSLVLPWLWPGSTVFTAFYQSGSLVFGGGHVVLPLLQETLGEAVSADVFLSGYAAAQAVPGPMFTLATYLGAGMSEQPLIGALIATAGVFLPGFLLVLGLYKNWEVLAARPAFGAAVAGINAAVVGLLLSALYQPVFVSAVQNGSDMALVAMGGFALWVLRWPVVALVILFAVAGVLAG